MRALENADKLLESAVEHREAGSAFHTAAAAECVPEYMAVIAESLLAMALLERLRLEREMRERETRGEAP